MHSWFQSLPWFIINAFALIMRLFLHIIWNRKGHIAGLIFACLVEILKLLLNHSNFYFCIQKLWYYNCIASNNTITSFRPFFRTNYEIMRQNKNNIFEEFLAHNTKSAEKLQETLKWKLNPLLEIKPHITILIILIVMRVLILIEK